MGRPGNDKGVREYRTSCSFGCPVLSSGVDYFSAGAFGGTFRGKFAHLAAHLGTVDDPLRPDTDEVAAGPVEREARAVVPHHEAEDRRHGEGHYLLLCGIHAGRWSEVLREEHGDDDGDRQDVPRVRRGE